MHLFAYRDGALHAEEIAVAKLADEIGTPFYCYSAATIRRHYQVFSQALTGLDALVCYAVKANSNQAVLRLLAKEGAGMDVVSGGELARALAAGVAPEKITFSGVGKTAEEISAALRAGIFCFNVESEPELEALSNVAAALGRTARVSLRVNPDVDARTHKKISTGLAENKFGVPLSRAREIYAFAAKLRGIEIAGADMHIGSQLTDLAPFDEAFSLLAELVRDLRADGRPISHVDLGGGLGIPYHEGDDPQSYHPEKYAAIIRRHFGGLGCRLVLEPGRLIVGNAGALVTRVIYVKHGEAKTFVIVDAGMNDLIRPTLYEGWHQIVPLNKPASNATEKVDVVGPICETGDFLAQDREITPVNEGDTLAVLSAGAYGFTMASNYNTRPMPAEILVDGSKAHVVRERQTLDDLIKGEHVP